MSNRSLFNTFDRMEAEIEKMEADLEAKDREIERLKYDLGRCRDGSAIRTRINDKQVARIAQLESALENSYCELCGCAECLEREQALGERDE